MSTSAWKIEYRQALRTPRDLVAAGLIPEAEADAYSQVLDRYALFLPKYYAGLIEKGNPACPIRLQAVPDLKELSDDVRLAPAQPAARTHDREVSGDPLGDKAHRPVSRITHRYQGRALLHLTVNCPMYCRYCFRKSLLNEDAGEFFDGGLEEALGYLAARNDLEEVILSGGDPLMVSDSLLAQLFEKFAAIDHLKRIRIHTRAPVTMPSRIDADLMAVFAAAKLPIVVVTHFNHPRELTEQSRAACGLLKVSTQALLNQSVLLERVNDDVATLKALMQGLFEAGVLPYYLHQLDRAKGTMHFEVPEPRGKEIFEQLKSALPGYLVPRYVVDRGDSFHKTWL